MKKPLPAIAVFFIAFAFFVVVGQIVFPTNQETNTVLVPDWYPVVATIASVVIAVAYRNNPETKAKREKYLRYKAEKRGTLGKLYVPPATSRNRKNTDFVEPDIPKDLRLAIKVIFDANTASTRVIQREMNASYAEASEIIDALEKYGVIGAYCGNASREILVRDEAFAVELVAGEILRERRRRPSREPTEPHPIQPPTPLTIHEMSAPSPVCAPLHYTSPLEEHLWQAILFVVETGDTSPLRLAGVLRISYSQAFNMLEEMEKLGIVGSLNGSEPRPLIAKSIKSVEEKLATRGLTPPRMVGLRTIGGIRSGVDMDKISQRSNEYLVAAKATSDEDEWRWLQTGLPRDEYELQKADKLDGHVFEEWCANLLRANKFINVIVTEGSGDQGVDVLAEKGGVKYAIQCKCYSNDLSNKPVQEVNAGKMFYGCHVGVVMTNSHFTAGAKELAKATGVLLWDRDVLRGMLTASE